MGLSQIVAGVTVFLTGLVPLSCHKSTTTASSPSKSTTAAVASVNSTNGPQHELGMVALTNHIETCLQLGGGKDCTFTPNVVDKHTMELTLELESKTPAGKVHDVSVTQVTAKSGQPLEIAVGDFQLSLTPNISE